MITAQYRKTLLLKRQIIKSIDGYSDDLEKYLTEKIDEALKK